MYSWGGSTTEFRGSRNYDYGKARSRYDKKAKEAGATGTRTYKTRKTPNMSLMNPRNKVITSQSTDPIIIATDVTGSMATWPAEIFDRLPLLYQTLAKYRPDAEFSFCAIGDAYSDSYPLQISNFSKEIKDLEATVKALGAEGGGGGYINESYELFGYYMEKNCKTPKARLPFLVIYGDELFYDEINPRQVKKHIGEEIENTLSSDRIWKNLARKFNLYFLQKPYGDENDARTDKEVTERWERAIGKQRIIQVPDKERAVDIAMGLIAKQWGEYTDFTSNLDARHDETELKEEVHRTLRHIKEQPAGSRT